MADGFFSLKKRVRPDETGFGSKSFSDLDRLILQDGTFNVTKKGGGWKRFSLYYWLTNLHWGLFIVYVVLAYLFINLVFTALYFWAGGEQLSGLESFSSKLDLLLHCFYFSTQTLTTVGYGFISPTKEISSMIAAFEAMVGLLGFAFVTSIIYGRFSKAKSKILFSSCMVVSPYRGIKGLKFRIANPLKSQIIELNAKVIYSFLEENEHGKSIRRYVPLDLEIDFINMFPLPWTIVHPLESKSPLYHKTKPALIREQTEFIVILKGYDDTFNQYVHQVNSYRGNEIFFDMDFEPMFDAGFEKSTTVQLDKISETRRAIQGS